MCIHEYTQHTVFNIKTKLTLNYPKSAAKGFFQGTQERVRNSRGKRAISVRATEVLLFFTMAQMAHFSFPYYFTIPNSEFRIPKFALRISEFGIVKYMPYGQVVTANLF